MNQQTEPTFPNQDILLRYLKLLRNVLIDARVMAYKVDPQMAELLDAVENIPDLISRWPDCDEDLIVHELERYEAKYRVHPDRYSSIIKSSSS